MRDCTETLWRTSSEILRSGLHKAPSCQVCSDLLGARVRTRSPPEGLSNLNDSVVFVETVYMQSVGQQSCSTIQGENLGIAGLLRKR